MLQHLDLETKVLKTKQRIRDFYNYFRGNVYISFSGGKDSTVLLDIAKQEYPNIKAVYIDTGLEFPEIKEFVKSIPNVEIIKPEKTFLQVIQENGYPVISKEIALNIEYARKGSKWAIDRLDGKQEGNYHRNNAKYKYLINAPFKISSKCCDIMKKSPIKKFERKTGLHPIIGTMASEGGQRMTGYLRTGCNSFEGKRPMSRPLSFWTEKDIWDYIHKYNVPYSKIYDMGYERTGCMFCCFGLQCEKNPNRFERMEKTHPQIYNYCMNKLNLKEVIEYVNTEKVEDK
jgi:3'-phosphoadenosine 5'-phosphosulfate sulfotransferase (PAPS reductase)/FAD synthetase